MFLQEVRESQKDEYNRFIAAQESGSFLQSWEWGEWHVRLGRTVYRFEIKDDSGNQIGSIQLIKMPLSLGKHYLYAPYGPVLAGGEQLKVESEKLKGLLYQLKTKFADAIFVRIEPKDASFILHSSFLTKTTNIQPGKTLVIDLSKSEEQLLAEMHQKTRYNIKVAQKHGVDIQDEFTITNGHGLFFEEAVKLISNTAKRQGFKTFTPDYYKQMVDFFTLHHRENLHLHIYKAVFQNKILATAMMVDFGNTRTFLFGGSSETDKNVMAPYFLHWQAMLDAKGKGVRYYDFWGVETSSGEVPGFVRFKLGFGGRVKEYGGAFDIICNPMHYKMYGIFRKLNKFIKKISR
jgi:lipid II:glycine glycyltransferase (peptidoglycan interpeptide bridge formation enzyme)